MKIIAEDCLGPEGMPTIDDKSVEHTITDPPYEEDAHTKQRRCRDVLEGRARGAALNFSAISQEDRNSAAREIVRVTRGWILVFCQIEASQLWASALVDAGAVYKRTCIWVKPDGSPQFTGDRPGMGYETFVACYGSTGRSKWNGGGRRGVYTVNTGKNQTGHQTEKPLVLMEALMRDFTNRGDLVLDPFAGSGTTGAAAKKLGRGFLGFEKDPDFAKIAQARIGRFREQTEMFSDYMAPGLEF